MKTNVLDKLGMAVSIGCMIHCLLMPLILPLLPLLGFLFDHDGKFHLYLSAVIVAIAVMALLPGYFKHKNSEPLSFASLGVIILVAAGIVELIIGHTLQITLTTVTGSCTVAYAHYLNHKSLCMCKHHH